MAVRTSFTAGEVLAAADLTDTFGAKSNLASPTFTGTPAAPTATAGTNTTQLATTAFVLANSAAGLVHINTTAFSAASSVSLNNVFTSTYNVYQVILDITHSVANYVNFRLRSSGSDLTSSLYKYSLVDLSTSAIALSASSNSATFGSIGYQRPTSQGVLSFLINNPGIAQDTSIVDSGTNDNEMMFGFVYINDPNARDGFTFFPPTGTTSGTVRVYGYKNS